MTPRLRRIARMAYSPRPTAAALAVGLALAGCGHVETHEVSLRAPAAPGARDPDLYVEGHGPPRPYYEVALLQVVGFGSDANPDDVTLALVARGRFLGCDAIVRMHVDQGRSRASGFGVCVRFIAASPGQPQILPPAPGPPAPAPAGPPPAPSSTPAPTDL